MKITHLHIEGLFGTFSYDFSIPPAGTPFLITGLNGYGKTTTLDIISHLASRDLYYFFLLPFSLIEVTFETGEKLRITSTPETELAKDEDAAGRGPAIVKFFLLHDGSSEVMLTLREKDILEKVQRWGMYRGMIYTNLPPTRSKGFHMRLLQEPALYSQILGRKGKGKSNQLDIMLADLHVCFIPEQRRWVDKVEKDPNGQQWVKRVPAVTEISSTLSSILQEANNEYLRSAHEKDADIFTNLLSDKKSYTEEEYNAKISDAKAKQDELAHFSLTAGKVQLYPYMADKAKVLTVYIDSVLEKMKAYEQTIRKLRLFDTLLHGLQLVNKSLSYSPKSGLLIKASTGEYLAPDVLSSGEQNQLIMLFTMIFTIPDGSLLLIDEPETSLHVVWQHNFLDNIEKIAEAKGLQVIIATHSPQIIGQRWEACYDLCEASAQTN